MTIDDKHFNLAPLLIRHRSTKAELVTYKNKLQVGFTLLEMVLVLFLIGLMASATLMLTENVEDQAKYDATKQRMEIMRKAIVGDPTRTVNGSPEISGFVADMGRLPLCIRELIEQKDCTLPPADPVDLDAWHIDASTGVGSGWRGPYIQVLPERSGLLAYRDGYGNKDDDASDALNFGWAYSLSEAEVSLSSEGFDIFTADDDVKATSLIVADDWQINEIYINFINQSTSEALPSTEAKLNLVVYVNNTDPLEYLLGDDGTNPELTVDAGAILSENERTYLFHFDASDAIPLGTHSYAVLCSDDTLFKGNCPGSTLSLPEDIKQFTATPRQNITLDWIIQ